jgi:hypothetical protein
LPCWRRIKLLPFDSHRASRKQSQSNDRKTQPADFGPDCGFDHWRDPTARLRRKPIDADSVYPVRAPTTDCFCKRHNDAAPSGPAPVQEPDASKVKHDGGEDDVDAIGNRKIGGRGLGDWYSLETEIRMGKQYAMQVESSVKLVQDPVVNEYVNRIGQNLVRNSDAQVPFTIKVIDSDEVNAFALPGGFFYVNSGLILAADEEAELAGVMAHEISHVAARHGMRQMTRAQWAQYRHHSSDLHRRRHRLRNLRSSGLGLAAHVHEVPAQFRSGSGLSRPAIHV